MPAARPPTATSPATADTPRARAIGGPPGPALTAALAVGVLAMSTSAVLVRVAQAPSLSLSFWRCSLGALLLAPFAWDARRRLGRLTSGQRLQLVVSGLLLALHFALWISSLSYTSVASSAVLVAMSPLFVGLGAAVFLGEPPSRRTWTGMALAAGGAVAVGAADFDGEGLGARALLGDALAFGGAAAVAGYLLIGRSARQRLPVTVYAATVYGVAAVVLLPVCLVAGASLGLGPQGYSTGTWAAIAALVIGPQLLGHTVFNSLLSTLTATTVAVVVLAEPVGAGLLAYVLLGEAPRPAIWLGAALILAGVWLAATPGRGDRGE